MFSTAEIQNERQEVLSFVKKLTILRHRHLKGINLPWFREGSKRRENLNAYISVTFKGGKFECMRGYQQCVYYVKLTAFRLPSVNKPLCTGMSEIT